MCSAMLDSLCGRARLADCIRNDIAAGITPAPAVERDEEFFIRADLSQPSAEERARRNDARALSDQQQRLAQEGSIHG
jgi:hypothetical protein